MSHIDDDPPIKKEDIPAWVEAHMKELDRSGYFWKLSAKVLLFRLAGGLLFLLLFFMVANLLTDH